MAAAKSTCYLRLDKLPMKATHDDVLDMLGGMAVEEIKLEQQGDAGDVVAYVRLKDEAAKAAALHKASMVEDRSRVDVIEHIPSSSDEGDLHGEVVRGDHDHPPRPFGEDACALVVRMRGLPFNATVEEIASLLHDVALSPDAPAIVLARLPDGRPTGDAYVHVANNAALNVALGHHNDKMGNRYVQVFRASLRDMHKAGSFADTTCSTLTRSSSDLHGDSLEEVDDGGVKDTWNGGGVARTPPRGGGHANGRSGGTPGRSGGRGSAPADAPQVGPIVELRGLPFNATVDDIVGFFKGFDVKHHDVILPMRADPRSGTVVNTGYAHVAFATRDAAARAREARHCAMMGNRYIECLSPSHYTMLPKHARQEEWVGGVPNGGGGMGAGMGRTPGGWKGGAPYIMYGSPVRMPMMGPPLGHGPLSPHEGPLEHPHHHAAMLKQHPGAYMAAPGSPMLFMPTPPPHGGGQSGSPTPGWSIPTTAAMHYPPSSPDSPQHGPPPPWFAGGPPPGPPPPYGMAVPFHPMMGAATPGAYYGSMSPAGGVGYPMGEGGGARPMTTPPKGGRPGAKGTMTPPTPQLKRNSSHGGGNGGNAAAPHHPNVGEGGNNGVGGYGGNNNNSSGGNTGQSGVGEKGGGGKVEGGTTGGAKGPINIAGKTTKT